MIHIFDGAMGTMLQNAGLQPHECPEYYNILKPHIVTDIHSKYIDSGATIIETNTFGANRIKLAHYKLSEQVSAINRAAVDNARKAARKSVKIAGSVGPTGKFIYPLGDLSFDEAYDAYYEQIKVLADSGVDYIIIETMIDIQEMRCALLAAKSVTTAIPVICQLSFSEDGRTVTGTDPQTTAITLSAIGADVIGANCSLGPQQLLPIIKTLADNCNCPISVQPNAGMPQLINGQTVFPMQPSEFKTWINKLVNAGASFIGGCCGTTPDHIKAVQEAVSALPTPAPRSVKKNVLALTSRTKTVFIDIDSAPVLIGERINPTGRKKLAADLKNGDFISTKTEAIDQVNAGAQILDINMGVAGADQANLMKQAITEISQLVSAPLAIDTSDPIVLEAGLKAYPGRALINSVSAEPERMSAFLHLAKKYGAAILCLPISSQGVPRTADERVAVIDTIIQTAKEHGLSNNDMILDALVLTIAANADAAQETFATLRLYRNKYKLPSTMGLSNISFGLPNRPQINAVFFAMCLANGLNAPIMNPFDNAMQNTYHSSMALLGYDANANAYSLNAAKQITPEHPNIKSAPQDAIEMLRQAVVNGQKEFTPLLIKDLLDKKWPVHDIVDNGLTAAMNHIGAEFAANRIFLPQVLLAAEAMRAAFTVIKSTLPAADQVNDRTIVVATVKGDIHDLGKNIVVALLENSGFNVIDLGKDIPAAVIVEAAINSKAAIVGLCSLMTTTITQIDIVVKELKAAGVTAKIMVGGAVLTAEYAAEAGADFYAADAIKAVAIAKQVFAK